MAIQSDKSRKEKGWKVDWITLSKFFRVFRPNWKLVVGGGITVLLISLLQLPGPFLSQYLIDHSLPEKDKLDVFLIGGIIFGLLGLKGLFSVVNRYILAKFRECYLIEIKLSFFSHIVALPIEYFKNNDVGYIMVRVINDAEETEGVFADNIVALFSNTVTFIVGIGALFYIHWQLALISIMLLPFYFISGRLFGKKIRTLAPLIQENAALIGKCIGDSLFGVFMVKSFTREEYISKRLENLLIEKKKYGIRMAILNSFNSNVGMFVSGLGSLVVLCFGILEIINGNLTLGNLVAFTAFLSYLYSPMTGFMGINVQLQRSISAMQRIFQIIDNPTEFIDNKELIPECNMNGAIEFKDVKFSYNGTDNVLDGISFTIKAGERVALVGQNGAGKTTLAYLIPRFYEPTYGEIRLNGVSLKDIPKKKLRQSIGFVPQDTSLFHGSILDNIRIANPEIEDDSIEKVVRTVGIDVLLERLSIDMNTDVGVLGTKISGGQKQLIAIARVLVKNPPILIFDEATAHLDFETEHMLKNAIDKAMNHKTTLIIAHRLATVLNADKILVLEHGKLVGIGPHEELYRTNDIYKKIVDRQFLINAN